MTRQETEACTILKSIVGSELHGTNVGENSDQDIMGVCVEPFENVVGFTEFEQFIWRSAEDRDGQDARSTSGDIDLKIYSLRKYLRLCTYGNPEVLPLLFAPNASHFQCSDCQGTGQMALGEHFVTLDMAIDAGDRSMAGMSYGIEYGSCNICNGGGLIENEFGKQLQALAPYIVSRNAGKRYLGYMESQKQRLVGERGQKRTNRPELEAKYGFDTKYAYHIIRLGMQGCELLETGRLSLPMREEERLHLIDIRTGKVPLDDILNEGGLLERRLKDLIDGNSSLDKSPDMKVVEDWMIEAYKEMWK